MLFLEEMNDSNSPPSYTEAINLPAPAPPPAPAPARPSTPVQARKEELKPKLCRMKKTSTSYGFHLNGLQGVSGHYIKEVRITHLHVIILNHHHFKVVTHTHTHTLFQVVKGGVADRAGLEDDDILVEVNGENVEQSSHDEVVEMICCSGNNLEVLVASKSVYDQLKADGVTITRLLLGETWYAQVHTADTPEEVERHEEKARPETPTETARERVSGF